MLLSCYSSAILLFLILTSKPLHKPGPFLAFITSAEMYLLAVTDEKQHNLKYLGFYHIS